MPNHLKLAILEGIISEMNHSRPAGDGSGGRVFPRRPAARIAYCFNNSQETDCDKKGLSGGMFLGTKFAYIIISS